MTPEELENELNTNGIRRSFRGYRSSDVEALLAAALAHYARLYKEKTELAEKVLYYTKQEEIIRNAIIRSEQAAADIRAQAEVQAQDILANAQKQAQAKAQELQEKARQLEETIDNYKREVHKRFYFYEREARYLLDRFYRLVRTHVESLENEITLEVQKMITGLDTEISALPKPSLDLWPPDSSPGEDSSPQPPRHQPRQWEDEERALLVGYSLVSDLCDANGEVIVPKGTIVTPGLIESLISRGLYGELIEAIEVDHARPATGEGKG